MKKLSLIILSMAFVGCGVKKEKIFDLNSHLAPYYHQFVEEGKARGRDLSTDNLVMKFGTLDENIIAICAKRAEQNNDIFNPKQIVYPLIVFNTVFWDMWRTRCYSLDADSQENCLQYGNMQIRATVMHEMGHCRLNLGHNNAISGNGFGPPESIMFPQSVAMYFGWRYLSFEKQYLDQLFGLRKYAFSDDSKTYAKTTETKVLYVSSVKGCEEHTDEHNHLLNHIHENTIENEEIEK